MGGLRALALIGLLLTAALAGCLGGDEGEKNPITIEVSFDKTNTTLEVQMTSGNQTANVANDTFELDFAGSESSDGELVAFTVDPGDGRAPFTNITELTFTLTYAEHGLFEIMITANDTEDNERTVKRTVRVDYDFTYNDAGNSEADDVPFLGMNAWSTEAPLLIEVVSDFANPNDVVFADSVDVTWTLINAAGSTVHTATDTADDDESVQYAHNVTADVDAGWWSLDIDPTVANGNTEQVTSDTYVAISYPEDESEA